MKNKPVKLTNRYTGEVVYCNNPKDVTEDTRLGYVFIKVFKAEMPEREYLVNSDAYVITD